HVAVLKDILERAGSGALVLLDEIGSGTDPAEGAALAGAILKALTRRRAVTLATTHLGALKQLAAETVGIVNASLQFDAETLTPSYRLLKGVPGRSYGLAIARRLGVSEPVLAAVDEATAKQARRMVEEAIDNTVGRADGRTPRRQAFALGDRVRTGQGKVGVVREVRDDGTLVVALGAIRLVIAGALLERVEGEAPSPRASVRVPDAVTTDVGTVSEVSLRGMRADEAEPVLTRALDAAVLADLPYLRIIHGKGTGALREMVHAALRADPRVAHFDLAPPNQGGSGATIAEFRT